ncbi:helix-turn-helix transcriptional regulator [Pelagibaculum spongiae]|uniref:WYL domain-containing protein n=1 Tax=Pelagibaculum spongiae TaxID=2080658 RepID=A0A2V1GWD2_9GAMM|nr:WYL domain-containing protein [Pelagibaculum spongiae]PVZ64528.1 WYL domain-containing protein [Pelagibaculum spongiae]
MPSRVQRHSAILRYIPQDPRHTTTSELMQKLANDGFSINMRMLQRDIEALCCDYAISCDDSVKPHRWFRVKGVSDTALEMTPSTALAIHMLKQHAMHMLPAQAHDNLRGFFAQADKKLQSEASPFASWASKVASLEPGFQLRPPKLDQNVIKLIEKGLIRQKVLSIDYLPRPPRHKKQYLVNPLGLVARGQVHYLVATLADSKLFRHFALHRIHSVQITDSSVHSPDNFDLTEYLDSGGMSFPKGNELKLRLKVNAIEGYHLLETPVSSDQVVEFMDNENFIIQASVNFTEELRWWLMSLADISEVLEPEHLREEVAACLKAAASKYS